MAHGVLKGDAPLLKWVFLAVACHCVYSVLLCLSNEYYDAEEYIRDYDKFVELVNGR